MKITFASISKRPKADVVVVPCFKDKKISDSKIKAALQPALSDFKAKLGHCMLVYGDVPEERILLLGLGEKKDACLRTAFAAACKKIRSLELKSANLCVTGINAVQAVDGFCMANYAFEKLKSKKEAVLIESIAVIGAKKTDEKACKQEVQIAEGVNFARDLVHGNADDVTPQYLAKVAQELGKHPKVKTQVFDKKRIEKEKMGLILAVNRGSFRDPHLLIVSYRGAPSKKDHTVIVGKGITYDTGGLNLKPTGSMEEMKTDMGGSAVALGMIKTAMLTGLKANITAVVPTSENSIGSLSYKPGDVYTSYAGKTVEIFNTDAEGRLVLADALAYAVKHLKPTRMIDFATLTGAIVISLGEERSGLFSNDDKLAKDLYNAGEKSGDKVWRLPLDKKYRELLNSNIADIKNCAKRQAGSITAAKFLEEFVGDVPWAHVDIAGTAYLNSPSGVHSTQATGVGIRLLTEYFNNHA